MEIGDNLTGKAVYDYKLIRAALDNGDQKAYAELMGRYRETVFFMLLKMVNNKDDAEDLTIEAFGKAFKRLHQYTPSFAFSTWLFKIATNNCIDFLRRKKQHANTLSIDKPFAFEDGNEITLDIRTSAPDPEENAMRKEKIKMMHDVVEKLKPRYRELVKLRYFEELSYEEISQRLDLPIGTVKAQLFRAREFLFNIMKGNEGK